MKKQIKTILMSSVFALLITACTKDPQTPTTNSIATPVNVTAAIQEMRTAYINAKTDNDSLNLWYNHLDSCMHNMMGCSHNMMMMDSTHCITMMHHCDSLYHHCDSIMMNNYNICHSNMSSGGGMMNGGMMGGNNTTMDCTINGNDCTTMINSLHQQHIHHPTH